MKKFMATAFAILMFGGLSFAQSATTTTTAKQNAKTEQTAKKHDAKANGQKAKVHHNRQHANKNHANSQKAKATTTSSDANQE